MHNFKIEERRRKVSSLLAQSMTDSEIAHELAVDQSMIHRDIKALKELSQHFVCDLAKSDLAYYYKQSIDGIDSSEIAILQELANTMGLEYGQKWLNGKNTKVAYGEISKFTSFLDSEIEDCENPQESETPPAQAA